MSPDKKVNKKLDRNVDDEYPYTTSDLAAESSIDAAKINRWRGNEIIPAALWSDITSNGRWRYKKDALLWIALAEKVRKFKTTEAEIAQVFRKVTSRLSDDLNGALTLLTAAYESSRDFNSFEANVDAALAGLPAAGAGASVPASPAAAVNGAAPDAGAPADDATAPGGAADDAADS